MTILTRRGYDPANDDDEDASPTDTPDEPYIPVTVVISRERFAQNGINLGDRHVAGAHVLSRVARELGTRHG
jgi:hypothetical protein